MEALFRLGLMKFRRGKYSEAVAYFERVLALNPDGEFEYRSLYWEWRSLQRMNNDRANEYVQRLLDRYPVTYYGLRAQAERNGGVVKFAKMKEPIEVELSLLLRPKNAPGKNSWFSCKPGGLRKRSMSCKISPSRNPCRSVCCVLVFGLWLFATTAPLVWPIAPGSWPRNSSMRRLFNGSTRRNFYLSSSRPQRSKISTNAGFSLMRQESSFQHDARSPSNALGLMQLLPATAQQIADEVRLKQFKVPDSLYQPETNIRLGSIYLSRMITGF